jgi:GntR family transcriptional regulator
MADILMTKIRSGEYRPGLKIPSENTLAADYGIGRPTVRQATDLLIRRGVLIRKRGSGTFVCTEQKEIDLFSLDGTTSSFRKKGVAVTTDFLQYPCLQMVTDDSENPFAGRRAYVLSRLSRVENTPVLIEDVYLHATLFKEIDRIDLSGQSLSRIVNERYYMRPIGGKQNFRIGYVNREKSNKLKISHTTPILVCKRFLHFEQAKNAFYSELYCRTDKFVFSQTIGGITEDGTGLI